MASFKEFMAQQRGELSAQPVALSTPLGVSTFFHPERPKAAKKKAPVGATAEDAALDACLRRQKKYDARASRFNCATSCRCRLDAARAERPAPAWRVSILCPTTPSRRKFHGLLVDNWQTQTYATCDLVVYDTGEGGPSEVLEASGCDYVYKGDCAMTLGEKRQFLTDRAEGDVCVLMDDDNVYAPAYVAAMLDHLWASGAELIALKGWLELHVATSRLYRVGARRGNGRGETLVHYHPRTLRPEVRDHTKYPKLSVGEEGNFARWFVTHEADDDVGIWVHVSHGANCASQAQWGEAKITTPPPFLQGALDRHAAALTRPKRPPPVLDPSTSSDDDATDDDDGG